MCSELPRAIFPRGLRWTTEGDPMSEEAGEAGEGEGGNISELCACGISGRLRSSVEEGVGDMTRRMAAILR